GRHADNNVPPCAAGEKVAAGRVHRQAANDQIWSRPGQIDRPRIAEESAAEVEFVHDLELATACVHLPPVGRETKAVERLIDNRPADDLLPRLVEVDDDDLVLLHPGVEDRKVLPARMDNGVDREVADLDLPASRPESPLVG